MTLQWRNARCRAFRTVRAAELHGANQEDEHTFDSMLEHLRCQNPSMDPIQREGEYINGLVCPWCNGGFKREKNFSARYKNGTLWCRCWRKNKCGRTATYRRTGRDFWRPAPPRATPSKPKEVLLGQNMIELAEEHQEWFRNRGISKETLERNRVCSKQTKNGKTAIVFPYYEGEKLVAEKFRALPKTFWQTPGGQKSLYGVDDVKDQKEVVITEGEIDKLSFDEAGISWSASLQNGASAGFDGPGAVELLASAERVVLAVDGDAAGQECAAKLAEQLNWRRCYMVKWPAGCKDANEVLLKHGKDALRKLIEDAQLIPCPWEMRLITEETSWLVQQKINGTLPAEMVYGVKTGWDSLDHLWRPVLGEITVVTGVPGHGKSEFLLSLAVNLGHLHNWRTLLFAFESTSRYLATQLYLKATGTCPNLDQQQDDQDAQYRESLKWVDDHIIVECDFQSDEDLTVDRILKDAEEEAAKGMKCLIIDPYNFIDRSSKEEAKMLEHHYIGKILQRLRKFAEDFGVHVIIVAHPTKASSWDGQKPTLYTIAGSSNWFNKTDNGLVIYRREIDDGAGGTVPTNQLEIVVEKVRNREAGQLGRTMLCFDPESRCYSDLSQKDAWTLDAPEPSRLESVSRRVPAYAAMDDEDDEY